MKQAGVEHIKASSVWSLLTSKNHGMRVGNVELHVPKGTSVNDCFEDVSLFVGVAEEALAELLDDASHNGLFPVSMLRCVQYNLALAKVMARAGHQALIDEGRLDAAGIEGMAGSVPFPHNGAPVDGSDRRSVGAK